MTRQTSIDAYNKIKAEGLLSARRFQLYDVLYHHGPMTQAEAWLKIRSISDSAKISQRSVTPRFAEMLRMGVLMIVDKRPCQVTGYTCLTWDVTEKLPQSPEKKPSLKQRVKQLEAELSSVKEQLAQALKKTAAHVEPDLPWSRG